MHGPARPGGLALLLLLLLSLAGHYGRATGTFTCNSYEVFGAGEAGANGVYGTSCAAAAWLAPRTTPLPRCPAGCPVVVGPCWTPQSRPARSASRTVWLHLHPSLAVWLHLHCESHRLASSPPVARFPSAARRQTRRRTS